jgi:large subunit ribosomal protein L6
MSRVAKNPIAIPRGVEVRVEAGRVAVKGSKGSAEMALMSGIEVVQEDGKLLVRRIGDDASSAAMSGTTRALLSNLVTGVSDGFERRLELVGVGYRAQARGPVLGLTLGFSHPVEYALPEGITAETPTQTEIVIRGSDKQQVSQVCAEIRAYRPPEPYKGKGVRYKGEQVRRKEAKKK